MEQFRGFGVFHVEQFAITGRILQVSGPVEHGGKACRRPRYTTRWKTSCLDVVNLWMDVVFCVDVVEVLPVAFREDGSGRWLDLNHSSIDEEFSAVHVACVV